MTEKKLSQITAWLVLPAVAGFFLAGFRNENVGAQETARFNAPSNSQPLALSADDSLLAVANPDNNSVTLFDLRPGTPTRLAEIATGEEPNGVAVSPDGTRVYVANTVGGTVTVLGINRAANSYNTVLATIRVGTEPYGLALTPRGRKLYVSNARSNSVSVIDTATNAVVKTISDVGLEPRGIAITNTPGYEDQQETVYVTQFLSLPIPGKIDGFDDAKAGKVTIINAGTDTVAGEITLNPMTDTGFKAAGDALQRIAPPATITEADLKFVTGAYPNQLNNIALRGRFAFVPNTGASPNGPVRFDVNTQSLLHVIDLSNSRDAAKTINLHRAVADAPAPRRFVTVPWAMALKRNADEGYVVSAASNILVKVKFNPLTGETTVQNDPANPTRVLQVPTGKNPRGIVITSNDRTAYVMNQISRDVTVVDLTGTGERAVNTLRSANLPDAGSVDEVIHIGKELYHSSVGDFDPAVAGQPQITGRMSNNGWGSCSSCHPFGLSDNVVWIFGAGPRRTIPQHVDFANGDLNSIRALNWSAIFDEEEDFENNIRGTSGGQGILVLADGATQDPALNAFNPASGNRRQLKVRGINAWDAMKTYIAKGIRTPISPLSRTEPDVVAGRQIFIDAKCQNCHGGAQWSTAKVRYTPAPDPSMIQAGQIFSELRPVGTFDATFANEVRQNAAAPLGAAGFSPPSLLGLHAFHKTYFHNGVAESLDVVMNNVAHRASGTGGVDTLTDANKRRQLIRFIQSIDAATPVIQPEAATQLRLTNAASYAGNEAAPLSAVASFGEKLAGKIESATSAALAFALNGSRMTLRDSAGVLRLARLFFVSPNQVNFEAPAGMAPGTATATLYSASGSVASGPVTVSSVAPGVFSMSGTGQGVAAAIGIRVDASGAQVPVELFRCAANPCTAVPVDVSTPVFVSLYGTGIRGRASLDGVRVTAGGVNLPILFAGAQGAPGLDQVNVELLSSLRGRGDIPIVLTVDGKVANTVTLHIQ
jgi:uncharacterized protein (TIGR03437 family)